MLSKKAQNVSQFVSQFELKVRKRNNYNMLNFRMVRLRRLELPRVLPHSDLNAARLPVPPQPHIKRSCLR